MKYLIENETGHAVWKGEQSPELFDDRVVCGDEIFLCFNSENSTVFEFDDLHDFVQRKYEKVGSLLAISDDWVEPDNSEYIAKRKAEIWEEIKLYRDHLVQTGGYKVGAHWYHSDTFSRTQQIALIVMGASIPAGIMWKTLDNGYVPMTQALAQQIFAAGAAQDTALFAKAAEHKESLDLSSDPDSYNWKAGWPETYQGV